MADALLLLLVLVAALTILRLGWSRGYEDGYRQGQRDTVALAGALHQRATDT